MNNFRNRLNKISMILNKIMNGNIPGHLNFTKQIPTGVWIIKIPLPSPSPPHPNPSQALSTPNKVFNYISLKRLYLRYLLSFWKLFHKKKKNGPMLDLCAKFVTDLSCRFTVMMRHTLYIQRLYIYIYRLSKKNWTQRLKFYYELF